MIQGDAAGKVRLWYTLKEIAETTFGDLSTILTLISKKSLHAYLYINFIFLQLLLIPLSFLCKYIWFLKFFLFQRFCITILIIASYDVYFSLLLVC